MAVVSAQDRKPRDSEILQHKIDILDSKLDILVDTRFSILSRGSNF